jgi:hypothetical protein
MADLEAELIGLLAWEYNRRVIRLPLFFESFDPKQSECIKKRPNPSRENLETLTKLTLESMAGKNPRALALILDEAKKGVNCKSIGYFVFEKNFFIDQTLGEIRRNYADSQGAISSNEYQEFIHRSFKKRSPKL